MTGRRVLGGVAAALLLAGCGGPELVLINRSDADLTVGPGVVIPACDAIALAPDAFEAARVRGGEMAATGERWDAPAGALVWNDWAIAGSGPGTVSIVVSGTRGPEVHRGLPAESTLPPCGGAPVGIVPGLPQGEAPIFEFETVTP